MRKFDESCLKQDKVTFAHKKLVDIYTVKINLEPLMVGKDFIWAVKLTKNTDPVWTFWLCYWIWCIWKFYIIRC